MQTGPEVLDLAARGPGRRHRTTTATWANRSRSGRGSRSICQVLNSFLTGTYHFRYADLTGRVPVVRSDDHNTRRRDRERVLDMDARKSVLSDDGPLVVENADVRPTPVDHRLDGLDHSRLEPEVPPLLQVPVDEVGHLGRLVHVAADAVTDVLLDDAEPRFLGVPLHPGRHLRPPPPPAHLLDGDAEHLLRHLDQPQPLGADDADRNGN